VKLVTNVYFKERIGLFSNYDFKINNYVRYGEPTGIGSGDDYSVIKGDGRGKGIYQTTNGSGYGDGPVTRNGDLF